MISKPSLDRLDAARRLGSVRKSCISLYRHRKPGAHRDVAVLPREPQVRSLRARLGGIDVAEKPFPRSGFRPLSKCAAPVRRWVRKTMENDDAYCDPLIPPDCMRFPLACGHRRLPATPPGGVERVRALRCHRIVFARRLPSCTAALALSATPKVGQDNDPHTNCVCSNRASDARRRQTWPWAGMRFPAHRSTR